MSVPVSQLFLFRVSVSLVKYSFCSFIFIPELIKLPFWVFLYLIEFMGCATAGGGVAVRLWSPRRLEGQDPRPHCWSVTCSHGCWCGLEPVVTCAASPAATVFSEAVGTAAVVRGPGLQALIPLFPRSISSKCSNSPAFRCTDVWSPLANCCVGQWHLCWVVGFIGCRLKGRDQGSFSLCHVSDITVNVPYFLIHSPIDGHLDYFQFWPVMSNVAMNIYVQVFCVDTTFIYLWLVPRNRVADTYGKVSV